MTHTSKQGVLSLKGDNVGNTEHVDATLQLHLQLSIAQMPRAISFFLCVF